MKRLLCVLFLAFGLSTGSTYAMTIVLTFDSSITSLPNAAQVEAALTSAAHTFEILYTNAVTINISNFWGATGPFTGGISLGASHYSLFPFSYQQVTNALSARRASAADSNAVASLPLADPTGGSTWYVPRAEAKALGLIPNDSLSDGSVGFASSVTYTLDPTNRAVPGDFDLIGVAEHEMSEVLGRVYGLKVHFNGYVPYDLFRFTNSAGRNLATNGLSTYFSVDDGVTPLKFFYTDVTMGDVQDWLSSANPDSFDAFGSSGVKLPLSDVDVIAMDILGYNTPGVRRPFLNSTKLSNGNFVLTFTNMPAANFTVLASTNVSLSLSDWTVLGTPVESPDGTFTFIDTTATANPERFYKVRSP